MIGCFILPYDDVILAINYYCVSVNRMRWTQIYEGECLSYDIRSLSLHMKNFRGYSPEYISEFIELFRSVDSHNVMESYHVRMLETIKRRLTNERRSIR